MKRRIITLVCLIAVAVSVFSCRDDDDKRIFRPGDGIDWPDRTSKEDCITIFEMAYEHKNIGKYSQILLMPDTNNVFTEGYRWYNQWELYADGMIPAEYFDYSDDIALTDSLFTHATELDLTILAPDWDSIGTFRSEPCTDCWKTTSAYVTDITLDGHFHHFSHSFYIHFIIGPDPENPDKYLIYEIEDDKRLDYLKRDKEVKYTEHVSLGEVKCLYYPPAE